MKREIIYSLALLVLLALVMRLPAEKPKQTELIASGVPFVVQKSVFAAPEILASAAEAMDLTSGKILFEKDTQSSRPLASITKIISLLVVFDNLDLNSYVVISKKAVLTPEPSTLIVGEHLKVRDLISMAMVESSNDAVEALVVEFAKQNNISEADADTWFSNYMNEKAKNLGANTMMFYNPTGLDITKNQAGSYGSPEDLMAIAKGSVDSQLWQFGDAHQVVSKEGKIHNLKPTNLLKNDLPQLIGSKTGYTDLAGGNLLVILEYPVGHQIGIVVMGSTETGRFDDIKKILEYIKSQ